MSRDELEGLMKQLVPIAERYLEDSGAFHPYAGALTRSGELTLVGPRATDEYDSSEALIGLLVARLRENARNEGYRATALVLDVRVTPPGASTETDAIRAMLEHEAGLSIDVFIPYSVGSGGGVRYGELFAAPGASRIFSGGS